MLRNRVGMAARQQHFEFIAQGEQAGRLKAEDRDPAFRVGQHRFGQAPGLNAGLVNLSGSKEGTSAAQGALAGTGTGDVDPVAGGLQDRDGSTQIVRFKPAVEGVCQQQDIRFAGRVPAIGLSVPERPWMPLGEAAPGAETQGFFL